MSTPSHIDDWFPLDAQSHAAQVRSLLDRLGAPARRVLDLGSGAGRVAVPLARAGHSVVAVDTDPKALEACRSAGVASLSTLVADFTDPALRPVGAPFDAVLCLGHTFMLLADMDRALAAVGNARRLLAPGGFFALDDLCSDVWRDVAEGNWQNGVSEDGRWQLVWEPGDSVVAIRRGSEVGGDDWKVREHDRRLRLWSRGDLALLARAAGFSPPDHRPDERLIVLTRPGD